jgi:hypothetical protein
MTQQTLMAKASSSRFHDHTQTHHIPSESSGWAISPTQRLLPDNTQHPQRTDFYAPGAIRTRSPSKRAAADPRHLDRPLQRLALINSPQSGVSYCVSGYSSVIVDILVFQRVGCDLKIGSMKKVDGCGVCGGDGQSCAQPLYHWEETAVSLCSVTCGGG